MLNSLLNSFKKKNDYTHDENQLLEEMEKFIQ